MKKLALLIGILLCAPLAAHAQTQSIYITNEMARAAVAGNVPDWLNLPDPYALTPLFSPPSTQTIFIAQTAAGGNTGADCADALVYTFFNTVGNWASTFTAGKISPGTTVEICGTITASAISTRLLAFQGAGLSGSPITLLFGPSASLQSPAFGSGDNSLGAIFDGSNFTVIDGGGTGSLWNNSVIPGTFVANGTILNTANGSGLANTQDSVAIWLRCSNCTVQNLSMFNMYVHSTPTDTAGPQPNGNANCINFAGSNVTIQNNLCHDIATGFYEQYGTDNANSINGNEIYNFNHGLEVGNNGSALSVTNELVFQNKVHDMAIWDAPTPPTTGSFHHDGMLTYNAAATTVTNNSFYDNIFYGSFGSTATAWLFFDGGVGTIGVFNNVFIGAPCTGSCNMQMWEGIPTNLSSYNNTIIGPNGPTGGCFQYGNAGAVTAWENNVNVGCQVAMALRGGMTFTTLDFNVYGALTGPLTSGWQINACPGGGFCSGFAQWQSSLGKDSHSTFTNTNLNLNSTGVPQSGSPAIGAGTNLASLAIANGGTLPNAILSDIQGNARPGVGGGAWTAGAFNSSSGGTVTLTPSSYTFATVLSGHTSSDSPVTFTLTNSTGVTITGITISFTGANAGDFSDTTSCGTTLGNSASCRIFVTFTPTAPGSRTATLSVSDSDSSSPQSSSLSGTGTPSVTNPSPANPVTFGVVVTDPSIPSTVKNENHSDIQASQSAAYGTPQSTPACRTGRASPAWEISSAYNFDHVVLAGFLHQDRASDTPGAFASQ
jgi:hypothetical protein